MVKTYRVLTAKYGERTKMDNVRLEEIKGLEEVRQETLELNRAVQKKRKTAHDKRLPSRGHRPDIKANDLVFLYDKRHEKFPGKLSERWSEPFLVVKAYPNRSLWLKDYEGMEFDTRVSKEYCKKYYPDMYTDFPMDLEDESGVASEPPS